MDTPRLLHDNGNGTSLELVGRRGAASLVITTEQGPVTTAVTIVIPQHLENALLVASPSVPPAAEHHANARRDAVTPPRAGAQGTAEAELIGFVVSRLDGTLTVPGSKKGRRFYRDTIRAVEQFVADNDAGELPDSNAPVFGAGTPLDDLTTEQMVVLAGKVGAHRHESLPLAGHPSLEDAVVESLWAVFANAWYVLGHAVETGEVLVQEGRLVLAGR